MLKLSFTILLWTAIFSGLWAGLAVDAASENNQTVTRKQLKRAAYNSLWRLQRAIEKNGFYCARVALNVWRSNAIDAGIFDPAKYDEYKRQIYQKSIENSKKCFETSILNENFTDARICLHTWKLRSQVLGTFDQDIYEQMKQRLESWVNNQTDRPQVKTSGGAKF